MYSNSRVFYPELSSINRQTDKEGSKGREIQRRKMKKCLMKANLICILVHILPVSCNVQQTTSSGPLQVVPTTCHFEASSMCGFHQESNDDFDWTRDKSTPTTETGPSKDHSFSNLTGHYMFIETSAPRKTGDSARLVSPKYQPTNETCLAFWYNMYGQSIGTLNVYIRTDNGNVTAVSLKGEKGQTWHEFKANLITTIPYEVVFEGIRGNGFHGDLAIDDFSLTNGNCISTATTCDFEIDLCGWTQDTTDDMDWLRTLASANSKGAYLSIQIAAPNIQGNNAKLQSPPIQGDNNVIFRFRYRLTGSSVSSIWSLNVYVVYSINTNQLMWNSNSSSPEWKQEEVSLTSIKDSFTIVIEGVVGSGSGLIAIDDLSIIYKSSIHIIDTKPINEIHTTTQGTTSKPLSSSHTTYNMYNITTPTTEITQVVNKTTDISTEPTILTIVKTTETPNSNNETTEVTTEPTISTTVETTKTPNSNNETTEVTAEPTILTTVETTKAPNSYCVGEVFDGISWWKTAEGETDIQSCQDGYRGNASRECSSTSEWLDPVYINCVNTVLHETSEQVNSLETIADNNEATKVIKTVLETMENTTALPGEPAKPIKSGDLVKTTDILQSIVRIGGSRNVSVNSEAVGNILNTMLAPVNEKSWSEVNNQDNTAQNADTILELVEDLGKIIQRGMNSTETKTIQRQNLEIEVAKLTNDMQFPRADSNSKISLADQPALQDKFYTAAIYKTMANILPRTNNRSIGSDIMAISFGKKPTNLDRNVTISFARNRQINFENPRISCGYWSFSNRSWSYDGCSLKSSDTTHATCTCNHLTNFAILMSPSDVKLSDDHMQALEIITYVGCGLSILGCLLTLIVYWIFWRYVKNEWAVILVNLCIALIIGYTVFLTATEETQNEYICNAITAVLHYTFLVVFFLMLCEGVSVVTSVTVVFKKKSKLPIYLTLAWVIPIVIVGITMGITKLDGYHSNRYCWLSTEKYVLMAFVGPAILVILINIIAIIVVLRAMYSSTLMANEKLKRKARGGIKCMVTLLPVLGLSWTFGVLSINEDTLIFQYLFGITTSLQGVFIFIFHIIFNKKIREGLRKSRHKRDLKAKSYLTSKPKSSGFSPAAVKANSTDTSKLQDTKRDTPPSKELRDYIKINRSRAYNVSTTKA